MSEVKLDDSEATIPAYNPICTFCAHWRTDLVRGCNAFPKDKAIPMPIWLGQNDHTAPHVGDQGVQFERRPGH